jgi:hypothetical protein
MLINHQNNRSLRRTLVLTHPHPRVIKIVKPRRASGLTHLLFAIAIISLLFCREVIKHQNNQQHQLDATGYNQYIL